MRLLILIHLFQKHYLLFLKPPRPLVQTQSFWHRPNDIAFCKNCMAPKLIKNVFPTCINIFLVSGIWGFSQIECGANDITNFTEIRRTPEEKSIEQTNLIICNSYLTINYFKNIYSDILNNKLLEKPIDTTKYNVMNTYNINYEKKNIDIISIASKIGRAHV